MRARLVFRFGFVFAGQSSTISSPHRRTALAPNPMPLLPHSFVFPPPPLVLVNGVSLLSFVSLSNGGLSELRGKHLPYSKFRDAASSRKDVLLSGRTGMLLAYLPAFSAALASFAVPGAAAGARFLLVRSALSVHFFKRVFEVSFIHQYSGPMALSSSFPVSLSYLLNTVMMIYAQYLTQDMAEPSVDLKYAGIFLFLVGIAGNFYHHYLLSKLRGKDEKTYKIPKGGLFDFVICPHYLFEVIGFMGMAFISQTVFSFCLAFGTMFYLTGRSYGTRKWYISKFENFPREVKAIIPYIF